MIYDGLHSCTLLSVLNKGFLLMNVLSLFDGISCGHQALKELGLGDQIENYFASEIESNAIRTARHNHNIIHLGDVRNISYKDGILSNGQTDHKVNIDLILAGSPCFTAGTPVLTENGFFSIEEIKTGQNVFTHEQRLQKVLKVGGKHTEVFILKASSLLPIATTYEHPFYVRHLTKNINETTGGTDYQWSNFTWKKAGDLIKGDYLVIPRNLSCNIPEEIKNLTHEDLFTLGEHILHNHGIDVHRKDLIFIARKFLSYGSIDNGIHPSFLSLPNDKLESFLDGLTSNEEYYDSKTRLTRIKTTNKNLAESLVLCVTKVYGIGCTIYKRKTKFKNKTRNNMIHIEWKSSYKKQGISFSDDNYLYVPFKSLEYGRMDFVYNLEVENDNSYLVQGACVHNCQGFSFAGKQLAFEDHRSILYFEFERILKEVKPKHFFLENVKMKPEHHSVITQRLGITPIVLNSSLFSAQNRIRYYWTDIPQLEYMHNNLLLREIIGDYEGIYVIPRGTNKGGLKHYSNKCPTITTSSWQYNFFYVVNGVRRTFTAEQCEMIAGLPRGYTQGSENYRIKQIGNGWSVPTVKELLKGLVPEYRKIKEEDQSF
jgi:site-specific DNA-cytosine methylase